MEEEFKKLVGREHELRINFARVLEMDDSRIPSWSEIFFTLGKIVGEGNIRRGSEETVLGILVDMDDIFGRGENSNCIPCSDPECKFFSKS